MSILDRSTDEAMVVMNLNEYEDLLNTTAEVENLAEEEMLSRLNHDINRWQEQNEKTTLPQIQHEEPEIDEDEIVEETKLPELANLANISQEIEDLEDSELENMDQCLPEIEPLSEPDPEPVKWKKRPSWK